MKYQSTKNPTTRYSFNQALTQSLPAGGGLFVPEQFPKLEMSDFLKLEKYTDFAFEILKHFVDVSDTDLKNYCVNAFNFPTVVKELASQLFYLELFHGPTAAFKDYGARFLENTLKKEKGTILVATSGDTGGAVASAFWKKKNFDVIILFPEGKISNRQKRQLTNWGENIHSFAVEGTFDDCQRMVKAAFSRSTQNLKSANSISIGRILPQMIYYAYSSIVAFKKNKKMSHFYIPTGNAGNACAALWAKEIGFPISHMTLCCNSNQTISNYLQSGTYNSLPSVSTLANAMDVGNPSNFERILSCFANDRQKMQQAMSVFSISDKEIQNTIQAMPYGEILCPHTATAFSSYLKSGKNTDVNCILVGTAHPAKFETVVEPLVGKQIAIPSDLQKTLDRPSDYKTISDDEEDFLKLVQGLATK